MVNPYNRSKVSVGVNISGMAFTKLVQWPKLEKCGYNPTARK